MGRLGRFTVLLFCMMVYSLPVFAAKGLFDFAQPSFIKLPIEKEQAVIRKVAQSTSGLMWFATAHGIFTFDGYHFALMDYRNPLGEHLAPSYSYAIKSSENGVLWAATYEGELIRIDESLRQFEAFNDEPKKAERAIKGRILDVLPEGDVGVWLATDKGLWFFDYAAHDFQQLDLASFNDHRLNSLHAIDGDSFYLAGDGIIAKFNKGDRRLEPFKTAGDISFESLESLENLIVENLIVDERERVWFSTTHNGAFVISQEGELKSLGDYGRIRSLVILDNELWLGTGRRGIVVLDFETAEFLREYKADPYRPMGLGSNQVFTFFMDASGLLWIVGWGDGVWLLTPAHKFSKTVAYTPSKALPGVKTDLSGIVETQQGEVWVSSLSKGIDVYTPDRGYSHTITQSSEAPLNLPSDEIDELFKSTDNSIWVAVRGLGMHRYTAVTKAEKGREERKGDGNTQYWHGEACITEGLDKPESKLTIVRRFVELSNGSILVVDDGGLFSLKPVGEHGCVLQKHPSVTDFRPRYVIELADNNLLMIDIGAIHIYDVQSQELFRPDVRVEGGQGQVTLTAYGAYRVSHDKIFLSTSDGVHQYLGITDRVLSLRRIPAADSKSWFYFADREDNVWGGDAYLLAGKDVAEPLMAADGYVAELGYTVGHMAARHDVLILVKDAGLHLLYPTHFEKWTYSPPTIATAALIEGGEVHGSLDALKLNAGEQNLSVSFAALDYSGSDSIRYRYFLEGLSKRWTEVGAKERKAIFTNIPPGQYVLKVQSTNRKGVWSDKELSVNVEVIPDWFQTLWLKFLLILLVLFLFYGVYKWRLKYYRLREAELEQLVDERTEDLRDTQKALVLSEKQAALGGLVRGIAHEFNTPLGVAKMSVSIVHKNTMELFQAFGIDTIADKQVKTRFKKVNDGQNLLDGNLDRLSGLVDSFKKISVDESEWVLSEVNISESVTAVADSFRDRFNENGVELVVRQDSELLVFSNSVLIGEILSELLLNSLKHAFARADNADNSGEAARVSVCLSQRQGSTGRQQLLSVEDNGCGISEELISKVFDPFTSHLPSELGLGLHVVVNQVNNVLSGNIEVENIADKGCRFTVILPIE